MRPKHLQIVSTNKSITEKDRKKRGYFQEGNTIRESIKLTRKEMGIERNGKREGILDGIGVIYIRRRRNKNKKRVVG